MFFNFKISGLDLLAYNSEKHHNFVGVPALPS
jgi:hypothetical protein